jgi:hypothetical protein
MEDDYNEQEMRDNLRKHLHRLLTEEEGARKVFEELLQQGMSWTTPRTLYFLKALCIKQREYLKILQGQLDRDKEEPLPEELQWIGDHLELQQRLKQLLEYQKDLFNAL